MPTQSSKRTSRSSRPKGRHNPGPEGLKGRVEEFTLQADLGVMGVRDEVNARMAAAENAWLAARSHLEAALRDADLALASLKAAVGHVLAEASEAIPAADAAARRSRGRR